MNEQEKTVSITYSAEEQKELDAIRAKYQPGAKRQPTQLEQIRKLDAQVESRAMIAGLSIGIVSTLVLGVGMSCFLVWKLRPGGENLRAQAQQAQRVRRGGHVRRLAAVPAGAEKGTGKGRAGNPAAE